MKTLTSAERAEIEAGARMETARMELRRAEAAFREAGEHDRATSAAWLANKVQAQDPAVQDRVARVLPPPDCKRARPEGIGTRAGVRSPLVYHVLEELRSQGRATSGGGWWRAR